MLRKRGAIGTLIVLILTACGDSTPTADVQIRTLSTRADLVSADDARIEIVFRPSLAAEALRVVVEDRDVTALFARQADDGRYVGLVTGLAEGPNLVRAWAGAVHGPS